MSKEEDNYIESNKKAEYEKLWLELEPRLTKPKRNKRFIWIFFFGFLTAASFLLLSGSFNQKDSGIELEAHAPQNIQMNETALKDFVVSTDAVPGDLVAEKQTAHQEPKNQGQNILKGKIKNSQSNRIKANSTEQDKVKLNDLTTKKEIELPSAITPENTFKQRKNQDLTLDGSIGVKKNKLQLEISSHPILKDAQLIHRLIMDTLDLRNRMPSFNLAATNKVEPKENSTQGRLAFGVSTHFISVKDINSEITTDYALALEDNLLTQNGFSFEISSSYKLTPHLEIGLGLNYTELLERFTLNNVISYESLVNNPMAFSYRNTFVEAEQCLITFITQNVAHNNSYTILSLSPKINTGFNLNNWNFKFGLSLPMAFHQNYSGTLFDEEGLIIKSGSVFDSKQVKPVGIEFQHSVFYQFSEKMEWGIQLSYRRISAFYNNANSNKTLGLLGVGVHARYNL